VTHSPLARAYVLDTWPIMAYFENEPAAEMVEQLLANAHAEGIALLMTVVNMAEVWTTMARQWSPHDADQSLSELRELGIQFIPANEELALQAARLKAKYKISLADCFAAALAQQRTGEVVTGDQEFKQAEPAVRIFWCH
jgi:predicted nucleic acid-binding protein